jgi:hypothetical protein
VPDELSELERLTRVWKDGGLTEEEFQARKAALSERRRVGGLPVAAAVTMVAAAFVLGYGARWLQDRSGSAGGALNSASATNSVLVTNSTTETQLVDPTPAEAFGIAFPSPDQQITVDGQSRHVRFAPGTVRRIGQNTYALVSLGTNLDDNSHAAQGFLAISYLGRFPNLQVIGQPFYASGSNGGFGAPPRVRWVDGLGERPVLEAISSGMGQGISTSSMDLFWLGETVDRVHQGLSNVEIHYDDSAAGNTPACTIDSRIAPDRNGRGGFTLRYSGSYTGQVAFTFTGLNWTPASAPPQLFSVCPPRPPAQPEAANTAAPPPPAPAPAPIPAPAPAQ